MANVRISELPAAAALTGDELVELVQGGANVQGTVQDIIDAVPADPPTPPPAVVTEGTTARDAIPADANQYTRFTNSGAKTYTFDDSETFVVGSEFHGRNANTGDLTITAAGTMVINAPTDGTLVIPPNGTFTVKIVAAGVADLFGVTVAA